MKTLLKAECLILTSMKRGLLIILLIVIYSQIVLSACTDTDKGENLQVLGITSNKTKATYDRCSVLGRINESVCENGAVITRLRSCAMAERCVLGRCVIGENVPCADTDKGNSPDVLGIVTYGTDTLLIDRCNGLHLEEHFCSGGIPWTALINCPHFLCSMGKCVSRLGWAQNGNAAQSPPDVQTEDDWVPLPEAMPPDEGYPCRVNEISWTDGYENNLAESGVGLTVFGLVTAENCEQEHFTLRVVNVADSTVEDLGDFNFELDPDTEFWFNWGSWTPQTEGEYYLSATIIRDGVDAYSYEADNSDRPLTITNSCTPEALPNDVYCELDPVTGNSLPSGQDLDCDGVDDCIDQWIYAYGGDVDPDTGIPVNLDCVSDWDCTQAEWGPCTNNNGRLTRTRDITQCTLPEGIACPTTPSDEKNCILEEQFPVFSLLNILTVSFMLVGYYFVKKRKL